MQLTDKDGNVFGTGGLEITTSSGKPKVPVINTNITIGTTAVIGGVSGRVLYNNAGVVGELDLSSIYVPTSRTLTINGVTQDLSANRTFTISTGITIGSTAIASGVVGRVLFEGAGNVVQESANLFWDNTNGRLGIGGSPSTFNLDVNGTARVNGDLSVTTGAIKSIVSSVTSQFTSYNPLNNYPRCQFQVGQNASDVNAGLTIAPLFSSTGVQKPAFIQVSTNKNTIDTGQFSAYFSVSTSLFTIGTNKQDGQVAGGVPIVFSPANTEALRIQNNGNIGIGTTTDAGFRLDVNGTARTSQLHTFSQGTYLDALTTSSFHSVDTGTGTYGGVSLKNSINNYNGLIYTGRSGANNSIVFEHTTYSGTPSANGSQIFSQTSTTFGKFNNGTYGHTLYIHQRLGSAISYPLVISNGINSTNSGVGILMQTSDSTGAATINHASITSVKQNLATSTVTSDLRFSTITDSANTLSEKMRISNSGNLLINTTTDAGFRLDVNGTARVQGNTNISGFLSATNYLECRNSIFLRNSLGGGNTSFTTDTTNCYLVNSATVDLQIGYVSNYTFRLNNASRSIGIQDNQAGAATTNASALLTLTSTTKGFLPPRMTTTQKTAISTPAAGLMVYDTDLNRPCFYDGTTWITL